VDDGVGFDPDAVASGNGQRLMRERAKEARGRVSVVSAPGEGTTVEFTGRIH
jgi:signal transduction histidine kinase